MDSTIYTPQNSVSEFVTRPLERTLLYPGPIEEDAWAEAFGQEFFSLPFECSQFGSYTDIHGLSKKRRNSDENNFFTFAAFIRSALTAMRHSLVELGMVGAFFILDEAVQVLEGKAEDVGGLRAYVSQQQDDISYNTALEWLMARMQVLAGFINSDQPDQRLSSKLCLLIKELQNYRARLIGQATEQGEEPTIFRGIVFVQRRATAIALARLLRDLDEGFPTCAPFIGHGSEYIHTLSFFLIKISSLNLARTRDLFRRQEDQAAVIAAFRKGTSDLLIATSVAEEGLDIQPCNLVVRFDGIHDLTAYIQSRGRARHKDAEYVVMVREDDEEQKQKLELARLGEEEMNAACGKRHNGGHSGKTPRRENERKEWKEGDYLKDESTGAFLSMRLSVQRLRQYCDKLQSGLSTRPEVQIICLRRG